MSLSRNRMYPTGRILVAGFPGKCVSKNTRRRKFEFPESDETRSAIYGYIGRLFFFRDVARMEQLAVKTSYKLPFTISSIYIVIRDLFTSSESYGRRELVTSIPEVVRIESRVDIVVGTYFAVNRLHRERFKRRPRKMVANYKIERKGGYVDRVTHVIYNLMLIWVRPRFFFFKSEGLKI